MSNNPQIPAVRPMQFESSAGDLFKDSVNLFRGDVNLSLDLLSLKGKNGLDVQIKATYSSNVKSLIRQSNAASPTGILGLGWNLGFERIEAGLRDNGMKHDNRYYIFTGNSSIELVRSNKTWQRTSIAAEHSETLNAERISDAVIGGLSAGGLQLHQSATVENVEPGKKWRITDHYHQITYNVEHTGDSLAVMAGGESYECFQYDFSQLLYYPEFERWELVRDNGSISYFGGLNPTETRANSIQWKVVWGNWSGQSAKTTGKNGQPIQQRIPLVWNLSSVSNIWGDTIDFAYDVVEQQVGAGGLAFTKACYLSVITDMFNRRATFSYGEKNYVPDSPSGPREYMAPNWNDPYTKQPDNNPGPYQDRYETRFLENITVVNTQQELLFTAQLDYDGTTNFSGYEASDFLYGDTVKRTLKSITRVFPDHCSQPGLDFMYWPSGNVNAGAMSGAVTPEGAKIAYHFKEQVLPLCDRQLQIENPWPGIAKPRVWFGADYVLNAWVNESTEEIRISFYTWMGRWQKWEPEDPVIKAGFDINTINAETAEDFACFSFGNAGLQQSTVYTFHKNDRTAGEWSASEKVTLNSMNIMVKAGENFYLVCDQDNRLLYRYTFNDFTKQWVFSDQSSVLRQGNVNATPYITAINKHYALLDYGPDTGNPNANPLTLFYQDGNYAWSQGGQLTLSFTMGGMKPQDSFGFTTSSSFIALTYINTEVSNSFDYTVKVISWDVDYNNLAAVDFRYTQKKANSKGITIPFIAGFVNNSMLVSGPFLLRYNGAEWLSNNKLNFRSEFSIEDINWLAYGNDYAIFTSNRENACDSKLISFDPNRNSETWANGPVTLFSREDPTKDRKIRYFPTAGVDIATMDNRVYNRRTLCNWEDAVGTYNTLPAAINTTTVINQGPRFLSFLNLQNEQPVSSSVIPLLNQQMQNAETIPQRYFTRIGNDGSQKQNTNGQYPAGPSTLVTSLPLSRDFDRAESITLHRYLDHEMEGGLVDYCVDKVTIDDGYQVSATSYRFDIASAACDPGGTVFKYYKSYSYPGTEDASLKPFGYTENTYYNSFFGEDGANEEKYRSVLLDGQLIRRNIYDSDGRLLSGENMDLEVFTAVTVNGITYDLYGGYTRCTATHRNDYGMEKTVLYTFEPGFGKLEHEEFDIVTAEGTTQTLCKYYSYAFQAYPWFLERNVIDAPMAEKTSIRIDGKEGITAGNFQAYSEWRGPEALAVWCTSGSYILQEEIPFGSMDVRKLADEGPGAEWLKVNTVVRRTSKGAIAEQQDSTGKTETFIWSADGAQQVASFTNEGTNSCAFTGFEQYENYAAEWSVSNGNTLSGYIVNGDAYTGYSSFQLIPGITLRKDAPLTQSQKVIVSGWVKAPAGFLSENGSVSCIIESEGSTVATLEIVPAEEETWEFWHGVVELPNDAERTVSLSFVNSKTTGSLLFNNICFSPLAGYVTAKFFDNRYMDEIASLNRNGGVVRSAYDPYRRKTAETTAGETAAKGIMNYAAKAWQTGADFNFRQDDPNAIFEMLPAEGGLYETFTNGSQLWKNWQSAEQAQWSERNAKLFHTGNQTGSISWKNTAGTYAAGFSVSSSAVGGASFGCAIGADLNVEWNPQNGWTMLLNGSSYTNTALNGMMPSTVWIVPYENNLLVIADGRIVFAEKSASQPAGQLKLTATGEMSFSAVMTYISPQLSVKYNKGTGTTIQNQVVDENNCFVKGTYFNEMGYSIAETKIAAYEGETFGYRTDFITSYDKATGILFGYVSDYYPEDEGYPYAGTRYEKSSLARMIKKGLPGKEFAITAANEHVVSQQYGVETQSSVAGIPFVKGAFMVNTTTDATGSTVYSMYDRTGRALAKETISSDGPGTVLQAAQQIYDPAGNVSEIRTPNYFSGIEGNAAFVTRQGFNFLKQMISQETTDSGITQFIYDKAGRVRFCQNQLSLSEGNILYKKYDMLGRITEEGKFAGEWGNGSALQELAYNDPEYPLTDDWDLRNTFDGEGENANLLGQAWKSYKRNKDRLTVENAYGYDLFGNTMESVLTLPGETPYAVSYAYNNLGNVKLVTYPEGSAQPQVTYGYNMMGQNITVGTPEQPDKFATYIYNANGSLASEALNANGNSPMERAMEYTSPGWIKTIGNKFSDGRAILDQSFSYTSGGYQDAGYFNGNIAAISTVNGIHPEKSFDFKYRYDNRGQLTVAEHSSDPRLSFGVAEPATFDGNGNISGYSQGKALKHYSYEARTNKVVAVSMDDVENQLFGYDATGNIFSSTLRNITGIDYNALNNLPVTLRKEEATTDYFYNGLNQRVQRQSDGNTKIYIHGLNDYPLMEIVNNVLVQYIYGVGGMLVMLKEAAVHFILKDQQGSVRAVVNADGTVEAMIDYAPFGELLNGGTENVAIIDYRYAGQEFESETGLYNYRARFYDADLGRFYSVDPKFQYGSPYVYCINNPLNLMDRNGEDFGLSFLTIVIIGALIGATVTAGVAAYTGWQAGLRNWELVGYIAAGAAIGAAGGALSAATGVGAFAAGAAVAASATTTAGGIVAGVLTGAAIGAVIGAGVTASTSVAQYFVNDAFGVQNSSSSWQEAAWKGAVKGAVGGAVTGAVAGGSGAFVAAQAARWTQLTGQSGWYQNATGTASRATQVVEAYNSFTSMAIVPLPSIFTRIPTNGLQNFVTSKFNLLTLTSGVAGGISSGVGMLLPGGGSPSEGATSQSTAPQNTFNPSASNTVGMQGALVIDPSLWKSLE